MEEALSRVIPDSHGGITYEFAINRRGLHPCPRRIETCHRRFHVPIQWIGAGVPLLIKRTLSRLARSHSGSGERLPVDEGARERRPQLVKHGPPLRPKRAAINAAQGFAPGRTSATNKDGN